MDDLLSPGTDVELRPTALVHGGAALARTSAGRVVFVDGGLPGEHVRAKVTEVKRDFARASVVEILGPSPDRVEPPCSLVGAGCGGCDLQHVRAAAQPLLKRSVVVDALERTGRVDQPDVTLGPPLQTEGYRTTIRCGVVDGRLAFRRRASHDLLAVDSCLVAHPLVDEIVQSGLFPGITEVTVRAGAATGERIIITNPGPASPQLVCGVPVVGARERGRGSGDHYHEIAAAHRFRVSSHSFFQAHVQGADALVDAVRLLGADQLLSAKTIVDAYAGVGLFAAAFAGSRDGADVEGPEVVALEWSRSSSSDATVNLEKKRARVLRVDVERWRPQPADVVIADPSRQGLGRGGADVLAATGAPTLVLVSCDPAALGRDTTLLRKHGYRFERAVVIDLFPHTHHIEVVSRFVR